MLSIHPTYLLAATQPPPENSVGVACSMRDVWCVVPVAAPFSTAVYTPYSPTTCPHSARNLPQYHILGPSFTWGGFFKGMDTDGDGQFDVDEFIAAIAKVYHDELLNEDGSKHVVASDPAADPAADPVV